MSPELTGRDLDAAVAKALGFWARVEYWVMKDDAIRITFNSKSQAEDWLQERVRDWPAEFDGYDVVPVNIWPAYSTDWAAAGLVIEEMRKRGRFIEIHADEVGFSCQMVDPLSHSDAFQNAENGPECICRAALEAIR